MEIKRDSALFRTFMKNYWDYYRELEKEFLNTRKYVEFSTGNNSTYSIEYLKLYQAVCSEIDVVGKVLAQIANPSFRPEDRQNSIYKWWYEIQDAFLLTDGPYTYMNPAVKPTRFAITEYRCMLIDEIEMHLHPAWQWTILKALRETFPCIQFIISTHSPIVLSSAKDAALYLMQDPNNIKKMNTGYGFQVNDVLMILQGSRYQPDRVSDYYNQIESILESGTDEDLNHLLEKAKDEFADAPHVLKEIKDFVEVNRWVEEA